MLKKNRGITLIALVVTIIVLLILAGVSITMLSGDNGIINKAQEAKDKTESSNDKSNIGLVMSEYQIGKYSKDESLTLEELLEEESWCQKVESIGSSTFVTTTKGKVYTIDINGNVLDGKVLSKIEKYFLGNDGNGVSLDTIMVLGATLSFKDNDIITDASTSVIYAGINESTYEIKALYEGKLYVVKLDIDAGKTKALSSISLDNIIYNGNRKVLASDKNSIMYEFELEGIKKEIRPDKKYMFKFTLNGEEIMMISTYGMYFNTWPGAMGVSENLVCLAHKNRIKVGGNLADPASNEVILNCIYEIGDADDCVVENGFVLARFASDGVWTIYETPDGEYDIPTHVKGFEVGAVSIDCLNGTIPTFTYPVKLSHGGEPIYFEKMIVTTSDIQFILDFGSYSGFGSVEIIDFTEAGDDIALTTLFVENNSAVTFYVTEAVKAKFESYDNVQVK